MRAVRAFGFGLMLISGVAHTALAAPPPVEIYGNDPDITDVSISPDGGKIALMQSRNGKQTLMVLNLATMTSSGIGTSDLKVRDIDWSGPNHVLLYVSITTLNTNFRSPKIEFGAVFSIDVRDMSKPKQLLAGTKSLALQSSLNDVRAYVGNDSGDVYMAARMAHGGDISGTEDLLRVNGISGRGTTIARGQESTRYWVVSPKGYIIARVDHQEKADRYRILVPTDEERQGEFKAVFSEETEIPNITVYGATTDEKHLIVGGWKSSDRRALFKMSLDDGKLEEALFEHDRVDVLGVIEDPSTGAIVGANYVLNGPEQIFFENDLQAVLRAMQQALPGKAVRLRSWSNDRKKFVVFAQGAGDPGTYLLFDLPGRRLSEVGATRERLDPKDVANVESFYFKTRDDWSIHAFLTVPPGREAKNMPLVVLPHGGPASRDSTAFDYWAQFLASRGYGVLQVNFRGSEGYGDNFEIAGHREWGGKMQDDVTDGVQHVIKEGIADPARICIVGGSYGGYAALAGAAFTPDLYKCAAAMAGVSDLERMLFWERNRYGGDSATVAYWKKSIGDPDVEREMIRARSPVNSADKIKAEVLLIHGTDDTVVDYKQSEMMADALKAAGKPFEFVTLKKEDHWASKPNTRIEMLRALETFLAKHLGSAVAAN